MVAMEIDTFQHVLWHYYHKQEYYEVGFFGTSNMAKQSEENGFSNIEKIVLNFAYGV